MGIGICPDCRYSALKQDGETVCLLCNWHGAKPLVKFADASRNKELSAERDEKLSLKSQGRLFFVKVYVADSKFLSDISSRLSSMFDCSPQPRESMLIFEISRNLSDRDLNKIKSLPSVSNVELF